MNRVQAVVLATSAMILGGLWAWAADGQKAASAAPSKPAQPVIIESPLPLPVTGTVTAEQGGAWSVGITGVPSVHIANSPSVTIANGAAQPLLAVNLSDQGRAPYQFTTLLPVSACQGQTQCMLTSPTVPAGHRLVVTRISGDVQFDADPTKVTVSIEDPLTDAFLAGIQIAQPSLGTNQFNADVLFYVDAGHSFRFNALSLFGVPFSTFLQQTFVASGYLVDCNVAPCGAIAP
jgi:hypothetical protein